MKARYLAPIALLSACASQPQEAMIMSPVPQEPEIRIVKEPIYVMQEPAKPTKLKKARDVDPATATAQANKSILIPRPEGFIGSTLEYPIVEGWLYRVLTAPNDLTAIELPPGCRFHAKSPYIGDNTAYQETPESEEEPNWEVIKSAHGGRDGPVAKVLIRPRLEGMTTTLQADTTCGAFRYKLESTKASANQTVKFRKELKDMGFPEAPEAQEGRQTESASACDAMPVATATFGYTVSGDSAVWAPHASRIFHNGKKDGGKTCVKMSDSLAADEYPIPFIPTAGKEATVFSRITEGGYMEFDKVLPFLALRLNDQTVTIRLAQ
jgi:type IV secretory pathway VirB9-like protein